MLLLPVLIRITFTHSRHFYFHFLESDTYNFEKSYWIHNGNRWSYLLHHGIPHFNGDTFIFFLSCSQILSLLLFLSAACHKLHRGRTLPQR